jgi:hypothetical protein
LDPNNINEISLANSRRNISKLVKDETIIKKPNVVHSRARVQLRNEAKRKGRHTGESSDSSIRWRVILKNVVAIQESEQKASLYISVATQHARPTTEDAACILFRQACVLRGNVLQSTVSLGPEDIAGVRYQVLWQPARQPVVHFHALCLFVIDLHSVLSCHVTTINTVTYKHSLVAFI